MSLLCKACAKWLDRAALLVVVSYLLLAAVAQWGGIAGVGLDPVWAAVQQRGTLRVVTDPGWRPFADSQNGQLVGYDIDLAREVGRRLGVAVEFKTAGYDALYDALVNGDADMVAAALPYAPEQGERARFSEFYFNAGQVLVVPQPSQVAGVNDLRGRTVGVALGSDADGLARRLAAGGAGFTLRSNFDEPDAVLAALTRGELDAALLDNVAALIGVHRHTGLRVVAPALTLEPYALAMPAAAFQLNAEVNSALTAMQREGFLERLNERWLR